MKASVIAVVLSLFLGFMVSGAQAADVTLKGEMMCAKCALKEADKCQNVLKVTEGGKDTKYYIVHDEVSKKSHGKVCSGPAKATVKGTVKDEGGKKTVTATEISYE